jgi:hypothetical protein
MTKDIALRLALEALEEIGLKWPNVLKAIDAIKETLETKDEPVAYINVEERKLEWATEFITWETPTVVNLPKIPLYITPQRTWVGLTVDEIAELVCNLEDPENRIELGKKFETKLKDKNT